MEEERRYHLRMSCTHLGASKDIDKMQVEMLNDDSWVVVSLGDPNMSPFKIFMFSTLLCQNSYLYMNASERELELESTVATAEIRSVDFYIKEIVSEFTSTLRAGEPTEGDTSYVCERMIKCPVTRNLESVRKKTTLQLGPHRTFVDSGE